MGLCMFGADNCRASVLHPGTQLGDCRWVGVGKCLSNCTSGPCGGQNLSLLPFQNGPKHSTAKKTVLKAFSWLLCLELTFFSFFFFFRSVSHLRAEKTWVKFDHKLCDAWEGRLRVKDKE